MGALKKYVELNDLDTRCSHGDVEALALYWKENDLYFRHFLFTKLSLNTSQQNDILQDGFLRVTEKLARGLYTPTKGTALRTWIVTVLRNLTIDYHRGKRKNPANPNAGIIQDGKYEEENVYFSLLGTEKTHEDNIITEEEAELVRKLMGEISQQFHGILHLRYYEELSYDEITDRLGIPLGTVKGTIHRARKALRDVHKKSQKKHKEKIDPYAHRIASGDTEALGNWWKSNSDKLLSFTQSLVSYNRSLAEDILQDCFIKIHRAVAIGQYTEHAYVSFAAYVFAIIRNAAVDHYRKSKRMPQTETLNEDDDINHVFETFGHNDNVENLTIKDEEAIKIRKVLKMIPPQPRQVVEMRLWEKLSFKEIAERTEVGINTAMGRMRYALVRLRKLEEKSKGVYVQPIKSIEMEPSSEQILKGKKRCTKCKNVKDLDEFGAAAKNPDSKNYWCSKCVNVFYSGRLPIEEMGKRYLVNKEVQKILEVSYPLVKRLVKEGYLHTVGNGRATRFKEKEVRELLAKAKRGEFNLRKQRGKSAARLQIHGDESLKATPHREIPLSVLSNPEEGEHCASYNEAVELLRKRKAALEREIVVKGRELNKVNNALTILEE